MKSMIAVLSLVFSFTAFSAEHISFSYTGWEGGNRSYYSCDYVEAQAEKLLETLGAQNVSVRCTGGIDRHLPPMPVSVSASFDHANVTGTSMETVVVKGDRFNPSCGLNVKMMDEFLKAMPYITVVAKTARCAFGRGNWAYELQVPR